MAYISKETIDEIKAQNDIFDVIGSYIDINDKGKALCPFHNDHFPSFSIQKEKQIYKCFSCGESGNVITFVQKYENCSYPEALQKLADRVNIKINIASQKKINKDYQIYYDINSTANSYFKNNLLSVSGKDAMKYLSDRGLTKELINEFNIGLATSGNKLSTVLLKKYSDEDLINSDIIKKYDNKIHDTFQNRIIFTILDENSNVIAFSGRKYLPNDLNNDELSKYINSKETKVFVKSGTLYNINNAKDNIIKSKEIILTEGFMDTIRMWSIGYKNVVALMGTAFTRDHLDKILKYKCKVVLNLDQDNAGKISTISIGEELTKLGIDTSVVIFDDYKDSDEFIVKKGKNAFDIAYNNKIPFIDFKLNHLKSNINLKDTTEISKYINEAIISINELDNEILKELKIKELAKEFDIDESVIKNKLTKKEVTQYKIEKKEVTKKYNKYDISEIRILYLMINYDDVITIFENHIGSLIHDDKSSLAYKIIEFRSIYGYFNYSDFIDYICDNEKLQNTLSEIMKYHHNEEYNEKELNDYIKTIKEYGIKKRIETLEKEMMNTLDINKKIEIGKKIENINKEVLEW